MPIGSQGIIKLTQKANAFLMELNESIPNLFAEEEPSASQSGRNMTSQEMLEKFDWEVQCEYKGRSYLVRDNGSICRLPKDGARASKYDGVWTFGSQSPDNGYMIFTGNVRVHQIVCTAFHGPAPEENMVVDHIDTNRCNNRPENLRWVTRLENILLNPITKAKIELICGSVEAFLENPDLLKGHESENPNFTWMRTVTKEEAKNTLKNWKEWASKPVEVRKPSGKGLPELIFSDGERAEAEAWNGGLLPLRYKSREEREAAIREGNQRQYEEQYGLKDSLTPGAKQLRWKTPSEFLLCPALDEERTLQAYLGNLQKDRVFLRNAFWESTVYEAGYNSDKDALYVVTHNDTGVRHWALCKIYMQDGDFVHLSIGTFFHEDGAQKYFTLGMGQEWTGGEVFDDGCWHGHLE